METIKQKPLYPFLIVRKEKQPAKTNTGVALPTGSAEKEGQINFATVLRISEGIDKVKVGDKIQYKEYTGAQVFGEKDMFVIDMEEILYVLED